MSLDKDTVVQVLLRERVRVTAAVVSVLPDVHASDDVFQQLVLTALRTPEQFHDATHLTAWAIRAARHRATDLARQKGAQLLDEAALDALAAHWEALPADDPPARIEALQNCLNTLPTAARELLRLRYEHGLACGDVAARVRKPVGAVYQTLSRLHRRLRECIESRMAVIDTPEPRKGRPVTDDRLHDLAARYVLGELSPGERAELSAAVASSPEACRAVAEMSVLVVGLAGRFPHVRPEPAAAKPRARRWVLAGALAVAAAVLVGVFALRPPVVGPKAAFFARVEAPTGDVRLGGGAAAAGARVEAGQAVSTVGFGSGVTLRCSDGTRLVLGGETTVTLDGDGPTPRVVLGRGNVSADVARDPMTIATSEAAVETGRGLLEVGCGGHQTEVGLITGAARVTDPSGTPLMDMTGGEVGTIAADGTAKKDRMSPAPDEYRWHTDRPLPTAWALGKLAGGTGDRAIVPDLWDDPFIRRRCWQIRSENGWARGLFLVHADTTFRVRYRVDRPGEGQLLILIRPEPATPGVCNVMLAPVPFAPAAGGGWQTVDVPAPAWVREDKPGRPRDISFPWVASLVVFNTYEADLGLRVAEFAVGRPKAE